MKSEDLNFYSFFTKYSLMEGNGLGSGLISRFFRKILPLVPDEGTVEYILAKEEDGVQNILSMLDFENIQDSYIAQQLDLSIKALGTKILAFGLDNNIKAKYKFLGLNSQPFEELLAKVSQLPEYGREETIALLLTLKSIKWLVEDLRKQKNKIGTNFHLTITTRRILEYIQRIRELVELKLNLSSRDHWEKMLVSYVAYAKKKDSIRRYIRRGSDLIALEIVEHTSDKGEKYIAETRKEYWKFFSKALLGGCIIALFALVKLLVSSLDLSQSYDALFYSLNYALCFIVVTQAGGLIATKQPSMTASTIADNIDQKDELKIDSLQSINALVRKVFRSQFISIIGNFLMAFAFACLLMFAFQLLEMDSLIKVVKPKYLIKNVVPSGQLVAFAAIAGIFLALSGLIAGYIDNKVVASRIPYRISNSRLFGRSKRLAYFVKKKAGGLLGNIFLGFFLGSTFLLNNVLPFQVDIRHIAFSSSYVGYSILNYDFEIQVIFLALAGALLIGLVNLIVSFSITLYLALKSRGASLALIPKVLFSIAKDFLSHPLYYFVKMEEEALAEKKALMDK